MTQQYEVFLSRAPSIREGGVGKFVVAFAVKPPIKFASEEARTELGSRLIETINLVGEHNLQEAEPGTVSEYANASFSHELPNDSATIGGISGSSEGLIEEATFMRALRLMLNGE